LGRSEFAKVDVDEVGSGALAIGRGGGGGGVGRERDKDGHVGEGGDVERGLIGRRRCGSFGVVDASSAGVASMEEVTLA
jgi:hypothetical protein